MRITSFYTVILCTLSCMCARYVGVPVLSVSFYVSMFECPVDMLDPPGHFFS